MSPAGGICSTANSETQPAIPDALHANTSGQYCGLGELKAAEDSVRTERQLLASTSFRMNPDTVTHNPRTRQHQVEPVCLTARLSAITHPAAAATSPMMMHEFYGRRAAWVSTCRRRVSHRRANGSWLQCDGHVPDTFP